MGRPQSLESDDHSRQEPRKRVPKGVYVSEAANVQKIHSRENPERNTSNQGHRKTNEKRHHQVVMRENIKEVTAILVRPEYFNEGRHTDGEYCTMCGPNFCAMKLSRDLKNVKEQ